MNEKLIEIGEFIHESLLNGSSKTNPAFDEAMLLFVCNSLTILKEQEAVEPRNTYSTTPSEKVIPHIFCGKCNKGIYTIYMRFAHSVEGR